MKSIQKFLIWFLLALLTANCEHEEITQRPFPRLKTLPVTSISSGGAIFQAEIIFRGDLKILRYGFLWSLVGNPNLQNAERIIWSENLQSGAFSAKISSTLTENKTYFVRAFLETDNFTVYGEIVEFVSLGSNAPQIISISPLEGTVGDTLTIKGKNFSYLNQSNKITFNNLKALTFSSTDTLLRVVVPALIQTENTIALYLPGSSTAFATPFRITTPVIESVSPMVATFGDTIRLSGKNFSLDPKANSLFFGDVSASVFASTKSLLSFTVPYNLQNAENSIRLRINGQEANFASISLLPPVVSSVNPNRITRFVNGSMVISGKNFNPLPDNNHIYLGNTYARVLTATRNELTVKFPEDLLVNKLLSVKDTLDITIDILGQIGLLENAVEVDYRSTWTRMNDFPGNPRIFGASFAIGSKGYVGLGCYSEPGPWYKDFWEYDPDHDTWTRLEDFPGVARSKFATFVIGNKAYIVTGVKGNSYENANNLSEVWEFNGDSKSWTRKSDFPGGARWNSFGFAVNGKGFVGGGVLGNYEMKTDFWKYTPHTDSWAQMKDIGEFWKEDIFAISDDKNGYILTEYCGSPCYQRYFRKYDAAADSWSEVRNMPGPFLETAGFVLNGRIYTGTGIFSDWEGVRDFFGYDPVRDEWKTIPFVEKRRAASSFAIGNYGYLLLGKSGSHEANKRDVWRFDPNLPAE